MSSQKLRSWKWIGRVLAVITATVLLTVFNYWLSLNQLGSALEGQLRDALPNKIIEAGINETFQDDLNNYLVKRLNHDFSQLHLSSAFSAVNQCRAEVLRIHGKEYSATFTPAKTLNLHWPINDHIQELKLGFDCQWQWPKLIASQFSLCLLAVLMWAAIAPPLSPRRRQIVRALREQGISQRRAAHLSRGADRYTLKQQQALTRFLAGKYPHPDHYFEYLNAGGFSDASPNTLAWLEFAMRLAPADIADAIAIAHAPAELILCPASNTVIIHGYAIKMSSTPFMYYLWYAERRIQSPDDGWFINPPSNRADRSADQEIIALMQRNGGHAKAIKDLTDKGLRAKTLDQNRSKIKDELSQILGEELVTPFLFEAARDRQTARSQYRLALAASAITILEPHLSVQPLASSTAPAVSPID